jgi:hypothetical protein
MTQSQRNLSHSIPTICTGALGNDASAAPQLEGKAAEQA